MKPSRQPLINTADRLSVALFGIILLAVAAHFSSGDIEAALLGKDEGKLEWGPALFRALLAVHGLALLAWPFLPTRGVPSEPWLANNADPRDVPGAYLWLTLLCVIGMALRLYKLGTCLWIDEMFTLVDFLRKPLPEIVTMFPSQNQHMLYSVLGRICVVLGGESAATARLPAVFFGVASIPALFLLGRRIVGTREALLACTVMTFSYHHVWFSQSARGYSGLLFFTTLGTWLWIEATHRGTPRWWVSYAVCMALGMWIHMTMLFVLAAHGLAWIGLLVTRRRGPDPARDSIDPSFAGKAWLAWLLCGTLTLQLHALSLPEFFRSALHEHSPDSEWLNPLWVVWESLHRLADGGIGGVAVVIGVVVMGVGWITLGKRNWHAALLTVAPALLGGGVMVALRHNLWPRFFFFCMGFFLIIAVHGGMTVVRLVLMVFLDRAQAQRPASILGTLGCLLVAAASATTLPRCYHPPKQDYWGARDYVEREIRAGDAKVAVGLAGIAFQSYFAPDWHFAQTRAEIEELRQVHDRVWLVYTLPIELKARWRDIWDTVQQDFQEVQTFYGTLGDGQVVVCLAERRE